MEILIRSLLDGARQATGAVAIIDVFRAFTTAAVVLGNGASDIVMVGAVEEALGLRDSGVGQVCLGEAGGRKPDGFDFGNSPFEVASVDFRGKRVIQRTSAGTQGMVAARGAGPLYAASLVIARATARALTSDGAAVVTLVPMGKNGTDRTDEDELCALHLRNLLEGRAGDPVALCQLIRAGGEAARFADPARPHLHPEDMEIALDVDRYNFAIRVREVGGRLIACRWAPPSGP
jgi:2-phosphosulfolactate phosphatase